MVKDSKSKKSENGKFCSGHVKFPSVSRRGINWRAHLSSPLRHRSAFVFFQGECSIGKSNPCGFRSESTVRTRPSRKKSGPAKLTLQLGHLEGETPRLICDALINVSTSRFLMVTSSCETSRRYGRLPTVVPRCWCKPNHRSGTEHPASAFEARGTPSNMRWMELWASKRLGTGLLLVGGLQEGQNLRLTFRFQGSHVSVVPRPEVIFSRTILADTTALIREDP